MYYPNKKEFQQLAKRGNLIPVYREILADQETPVSAFQKLGARTNCFLLESIEGGEHIGRYSFVGSNPREVVRIETGSTTASDPLRKLEEVLSKYRAVPVRGLPRFSGGAVGFLGYEYVNHLEPVPRPKTDALQTPLLYFMITDTVLAFDRLRQTIKVISNAYVENGGKSTDSIYEEACRKIDAVITRLRKPTRLEALEYPTSIPAVKFRSNFARDAFEKCVDDSKKYIRSGDIIQAVLSQRFSVRTKSSPLMIYRALRSINPSPYMFLMRGDNFTLIGASPEVHVRCEDGRVEIRPIAGTRPRGETVERDIELEKELLADPKERAEHLMLVDLARNDIGRVCDYGSVHVPEFMVIERYVGSPGTELEFAL